MWPPKCEEIQQVIYSSEILWFLVTLNGSLSLHNTVKSLKLRKKFLQKQQIRAPSSKYLTPEDASPVSKDQFLTTYPLNLLLCNLATTDVNISGSLLSKKRLEQQLDDGVWFFPCDHQERSQTSDLDVPPSRRALKAGASPHWPQLHMTHPVVTQWLGCAIPCASPLQGSSHVCVKEKQARYQLLFGETEKRHSARINTVFNILCTERFIRTLRKLQTVSAIYKSTSRWFQQSDKGK